MVSDVQVPQKRDLVRSGRSVSHRAGSMFCVAGPIDNDAMIMNLAAPRGGVCTRTDLLDHGVTRSAIDERVRRGLLEPVCRGVYVISGLASRIHGFAVVPPVGSEPVDVLVENRTNRRLDGVVLHRVRRMPDAADVMTLNGLTVTTPARTIVDLASVVGPNRLRHIIQTQVRDNNPSAAEVIACFERVARQGVPGSAALRRQLHLLFGDQPITYSVLEEVLRNLLQSAGIGGFEAQYRPPWYDGLRGVVDFAHPELRLVVEADGRRWHSREQEMADDRRRDRLAVRHGWTTLRFTWAEVTGSPAAVIADVRAVMATRAAAA